MAAVTICSDFDQQTLTCKPKLVHGLFLYGSWASFLVCEMVLEKPFLRWWWGLREIASCLMMSGIWGALRQFSSLVPGGWKWKCTRSSLDFSSDLSRWWLFISLFAFCLKKNKKKWMMLCNFQCRYGFHPRL